MLVIVEVVNEVSVLVDVSVWICVTVAVIDVTVSAVVMLQDNSVRHTSDAGNGFVAPTSSSSPLLASLAALLQ